MGRPRRWHQAHDRVAPQDGRREGDGGGVNQLPNRLLVPEHEYPTAWSGWGDDEVYAINRVIASDAWTMGVECEEFEREFAAYHGMRFGIGVNSGSSANLVSIAAMTHLGLLQIGDKAAVPALAWSTTYAPLIQHGLDLILLDADNSWCAARAADWAMSHKSTPPMLIVTCGILGNPAHGRFWQGVAKNCGAILMDDCCESIGAVEPDGTLCGTRGLAN